MSERGYRTRMRPIPRREDRRSAAVSKSVHLEEIPYTPDSCELFERLRDLPHAALLDSSHPHASAARFDILTAAPWTTWMLQLTVGPST